IAKEFNVRFPKPAGSVASPRYRVNDPIRKDKGRHHVMGNALRPQLGEDREAPIGGFAEDSIKPLSGFDNVLKGAILVIRRRLDTVSRRSELGTLSTAPDTRYSPEFWCSVRTCTVARAIGAPSTVSFSQSISRSPPVSGAKRPSSLSQRRSLALRSASEKSRALVTFHPKFPRAHPQR